MSLARLVITAVTVGGHSKSQVARDYGVTRFCVQTLVKDIRPGRAGRRVMKR
jgi:transposase